MSELIILVVTVTCSIAAFYIGHVLTKQHIENEFRNSEDVLKRKINHALMEIKKLEVDYAELQTKVKALGNSSSATEFNELYKKIREQMSIK